MNMIQDFFTESPYTICTFPFATVEIPRQKCYDIGHYIGAAGDILPDSPHKPQWHPAFYAATGLELQANHQEIQMIPEYNLSNDPIRIDLLIIKMMGKRKRLRMRSVIL